MKRYMSGALALLFSVALLPLSWAEPIAKFGGLTVDNVMRTSKAKCDGVTNDTEVLNSEINSGIQVYLPAGVCLANIVHNSGNLVLHGAGIKSSYLKSYSDKGYAFSEEMNGYWAVHTTLNDLTFTGTSGQTRNGFTFGNASLKDLAGRVQLNRVGFEYLDKAFHKPYGNIGNEFNKCEWRENNYHYYAETQSHPIVHAGNDIFNGGHFAAAKLAAVYIDTVSGAGSGQTVFNNSIFEGNQGFGFFIHSYTGGPLVLNNVWMEVNHTAGSVTINGISYTPRDVYLRNTGFAVINGTRFTSMGLVNSRTQETNDFYGEFVSIADDNSYRNIENAITSIPGNMKGGIVSSFLNIYPHAYGPFFTIPPRTNKSYHQTTLITEPFSDAGPWQFTGSSTVNATSVADGLMYDNCAQITIPNTGTLVLVAGSFNVARDNWYVYSMDVKLTSTARPSSLGITGLIAFSESASDLLVKDKWVTIGGIHKAKDTSVGMGFPYITNNSGGNVVLRMSGAQVVEFTSKQDAINYFNNRLHP